MHSASIYGEWEAVSFPLPQRSYLYSLPPIAVGTAAVESFTGYITRLAAAHALETGVLVNNELLPRIPSTKGPSIGRTPSKMPTSFFSRAFPLNGIGECARAWVSALERMTCVDHLGLLTCLPWAKVISCVRLLRTQRAWCPFCYGEPPDIAASAEPVYDRLLWTFQVVTACSVHRHPLESICPSCRQTQYVFAPRMRPGYCSRCQCWLGRASESVEGDRSQAVQIAEMVGELLAASPRLPAGFGLQQFRENARNFRRNCQFHPTSEHRNVRGWRNRGKRPRMDSLVLLSLRQNVSMLRLFTERGAVEVPIAPRYAYVHYRVAAPTVEDALQAALRDDVPRPLPDIAAQLGYRSIAPLRFRFHDLCREIVRKRHANLKRSTGVPCSVPLSREHIERTLLEALKKGGPVSLSSLASAIGLRNKRRLYKGFNDLRKAVVANNQRFRRQRLDVIESALRTALTEAPAPSVTDIARRLGLKTVTTLTRRFPDLTTELKRRRQEAFINKRNCSRYPGASV
jgi:hypothetical protein